MGMMDVPRCEHIKVNGVQCGSPALNAKRHCYFHCGMRDRQARMLRVKRGAGMRFVLPMVEDANSIYLAILEVAQMIALDCISDKAAGKLLYSFQLLLMAAKQVNFEPERVTDVVIDRSTVNQTCIGGPQWIEEEFGPDGNDDANIRAEASALVSPDVPRPDVPKKEAARVESTLQAVAVEGASVSATADAVNSDRCHSEPVRRTGEEPAVRLGNDAPVAQSDPITARVEPSNSPKPGEERKGNRPSWNELERLNEARRGIVDPPPKQASPELVASFNEFMRRIKMYREKDEAEQRAARGEVQLQYKKNKCRGG